MTSRLFRAALFAASAFVWIVYLFVASRRLFHPLELGNLEGLMMDHVARIARGEPLYVAPSAGFTPLAYMPLYTTIVGLLARVFGLDFWVGRIVSFAAATLLAALIGWIVQRETKSALFGLAASAIFLWGQGLIGGGYDTVRPDTLMLFLAFSGLAALRFGSGPASAAFAGLLIAAAFFTKQHGILFGLAVLPWLWLRDRARLLPYALSLLVAAGVTFVVLRWWLGPWFVFYVYDVPSGWSELSRTRTLDFLRLRMLGSFAPLTIATLLGLAARRPQGTDFSGIWWWAGLGGFACGLLATLDPYAYFHVLLPVLAAFAVVGTIAIHRLLLDPQRFEARRGESLACATLLCQLFALLYHPLRGHLPGPEDAARAARAAWVERLRAVPGAVLLPYHGFYPTLAGKPASMQLLPIDDVLRSRGNALLELDPHAIERVFDGLRRGPGRPVLFTDAPLDSFHDRTSPLWATLLAGYRLAETIPASAPALTALAGIATTPRYVYEPLEPDSAAADSLR
jgi:hypothetical protein